MFSCSRPPYRNADSVVQAGSASGAALLGSLGVILSDPSVLLGVDCSPISVVGVGSGSACTASPVCCENNSVVSALFSFTVKILSPVDRADLCPLDVSPSLSEGPRREAGSKRDPPTRTSSNNDSYINNV